MAFRVPFDSTTLAAVVSECEALVGGRLQKLSQPDEHTVVLQVHNRGTNLSLLLSCDAQFARAHLTSARPHNPQPIPVFCATARRWCENGFVTAVRQRGFDRIVELDVKGDAGRTFTFVAELMGKHSNVMLLDAGGEILAALKMVGPKQSHRHVRPGAHYTDPPAAKGVNPLALDPDHFEALVRDASDVGPAWLSATLEGVSPFLADQLWRRTGQSRDGLRQAYAEWREAVLREQWEPTAFRDEGGASVGAYPFPVATPEGIQAFLRQAVSEALDLHYLSAIPRARLDAIRQQLSTALGRALSSTERAIADTEKGIRTSADAGRWQLFGELILAFGHGLPEKAERLEAPDYTDPEQRPVAIPLDPQLDGPANAERYFERAKKARRTGAALQARLLVLQAARDELQAALARLPEADEPTLEELKEKAKERGWLASQAVQTPEEAKQKDAFAGFRIREVRLETGHRVLFGENATSNDHLTQRIARPNDWWLHVRGGMSAHAVIPTNNQPDRVPRPVLEQAAEIVARHSPGKHSSVVAVDYTLRKHVRKPRNAPPGTVLYTHEKTIHVTPAD